MTKKLLIAIALSVAAMAAPSAQQRGAAPGTLPAADFYDIQQLYARYCHGLDSAADNGYLFANVFTTDGVYVDASGRMIQGRERLAEFARLDPDGVKGPTNIGHFTTNITLTPTSATTATGSGYLLVAARPAAPAGGAQAGRGGAAPAAAPARAVVDAGLYQDQLVKTADGWRISRRVFVRANAPAAAR